MKLFKGYIQYENSLHMYERERERERVRERDRE